MNREFEYILLFSLLYSHTPHTQKNKNNTILIINTKLLNILNIIVLYI